MSAQHLARTAARVLLGSFLLFTGVAHLVDTAEFFAQVPPWLPWRSGIVVVSGFVELALGAALLLARGERRAWVGLVTAAFFVAIFPGNVSQYLTGTSAFGLDSDTGRLVRLFFQPVLVLWAWWCTGAGTAWGSLRARWSGSVRGHG